MDFPAWIEIDGKPETVKVRHLSRGSPRGKRYDWTPATNEFLRQFYRPAIPGRTGAIAAHMGVPPGVIRQRAVALGLTRVRWWAWTPEEDRIIEDRLHKDGIEAVCERLNRSLRSVRYRQMVLGVQVRGEGFTLRSLAEAFGVSNDRVERWLRQGFLQGERRHTRREKCGDFWFISEDAVVEFVVNHPTEFDITLVDSVWLMGLIAPRLKRTKGKAS